MSSPAPRVTFKNLDGGQYEVRLDGVPVGRVERREKRYNLRRVYVDRWWQITGVDGFNAGASYDNRRHHFDTRADAVAALVEYLGRAA